MKIYTTKIYLFVWVRLFPQNIQPVLFDRKRERERECRVQLQIDCIHLLYIKIDAKHLTMF